MYKYGSNPLKGGATEVGAAVGGVAGCWVERCYPRFDDQVTIRLGSSTACNTVNLQQTMH